MGLQEKDEVPNISNISSALYNKKREIFNLTIKKERFYHYNEGTLNNMTQQQLQKQKSHSKNG